jgi:hypothetical protein
MRNICLAIFFSCIVSGFSFAQNGGNEPLMADIDSPARAQAVMKALHQGHPRRVGEPEFINGDWTVMVRGTRFYYAKGRMLPENLRSQADSYDGQPFYRYVKGMPVWKTPSAEESARIEQSSDNRRSRPVKRSNAFFDALWDIHNRAESDAQQKTIYFLGRKVNVHIAIMEPLAMVEKKIKALGKTDRAIKQWADSIREMAAWNWRNIAETASRSNHSYGTAIDCLMPNRRGMETYWLWAAERRPEWWMVPYSQRLTPPEKVIAAFESYGFIWGGKWLYYDTMHFEYRPEILILNNIPMDGAY